MNYIKKFVKRILGIKIILKFNYLVQLVTNFIVDFMRYYEYSNVFKIDNIKKMEARIILDYHSIEKGMLYSKMKPGFAKPRVERLHQFLNKDLVIANIHRSQIKVAYQVMCGYYEMQAASDFDISSFYVNEQYERYKSLLEDNYSKGFKGAVEYSITDFYKEINTDFEKFAYSRKSVRNYTGEKIEKGKIEQAVQLALTSPSVCNRQANKVYLLEDKNKIDKVLNIQGGFTGYTENVNQLLILTNDINYYYNVGERNQFYIDGGIFLMNLMYSLHFYQIANCPANWGKVYKEEKELDKIIQLPKSEKIICIVPIGIAEPIFRVTLSKRRELNEVLVVI